MSELSPSATRVLKNIEAAGVRGMAFGPLPRVASKQLIEAGLIVVVANTVWTKENFEKVKAGQEDPHTD